LQRALRERDLGNWAAKNTGLRPIFDEEEIIESDRKTIVLDLDKPNDSEN